MYHNFLIHSSANGQLGCFHVPWFPWCVCPTVGLLAHIAVWSDQFFIVACSSLLDLLYFCGVCCDFSNFISKFIDLILLPLFLMSLASGLSILFIFAVDSFVSFSFISSLIFVISFLLLTLGFFVLFLVALGVK